MTPKTQTTQVLESKPKRLTTVSAEIELSGVQKRQSSELKVDDSSKILADAFF